MRRTRSQAALEDATAKTSAGATLPISPPAKKRKTDKAKDTALATTVAKAPVPARLRRLQRKINPLRKVSNSDTSLEFPVPHTARRGQPKIYYGQNAPRPRWRTLLDVQKFGASLERDLIRTHPGRTIIPGVAPGTHPKAHDPFIGLGDLKWSFEPGPASVWGNLTGQELYTYAHGILIEALECPHSRRQLREAMCNEQYATFVAHVEDPIPPPPCLNPSGGVNPLSSTFKQILASTKLLKTQNKTFSGADKYKRPELNYRPEKDVSNKQKDLPIVSVMKKNMKGTLGPVARQDPSLDPVAVPKAKAAKKQLPIRTKSTKKAAEKPVVDGDKKQQTHEVTGARDIGFVEKLVGIPRSSPRNVLGPSGAGKPAGDGSKTVRIAQSPWRGALSLEDMHTAKAEQNGQAQQRETSKDADKDTVQAPDAGSSQAAESSTALNEESLPEIDKILFPPEKPDEATKYLQMCNEIVADPEARRKHYPNVEAFRRVRTWAGAVMPDRVAAHVKATFPKVPTANRPFMNMKRPREYVFRNE